jgi:hypothetical protein
MVTNNTSEFSRINGIKLEDWTKNNFIIILLTSLIFIYLLPAG